MSARQAWWRANWPILLAATSGMVAGGAAVRAAGDAPPGDRAQIEAIVHDYILAHPEIIPEAMDRLRENQAAKAIGGQRAALETPFAGAWAGNPKGDVTLVMFSDYACGYCRESAPDIERLLAADPKLRVVWREIPVLGPPSVEAARHALAVAEAGGYLPFHRAMFAAGRPDPRTLAAAEKIAGADTARIAAAARSDAITREIERNLTLARALGISGTPTFVVGDTLLSGAVGYDALSKAVAQTRGRSSG